MDGPDGSMNSIPEAMDHLSQREEELRALMLSATDQWSRREQAIQAALESLESRVTAVQAEQKTTGDAAVAKAVAISNEYTEYQNLITRVRNVVNRTLPRDATVIVVSKGDNELLKLEGRNAWHFPQNERGTYAGYYPADSVQAITQLEALRLKGGRYLVFPRTALWWLEHYREFREHLQAHYRVVCGPDDTCLIYSLEPPAHSPSDAPRAAASKSQARRKRTAPHRPARKSGAKAKS